MPVRDHKEVVISEFNGLFSRGKTVTDYEAVPLNHFSDCNNIQFQENGFSWRDGIDTVHGPGEVVRMYKYKSPSLGESLISLDVAGDFWHTTYGPDLNTLILSIPGADDFAFVEINGRAYISPMQGNHGMVGEFLYVYQGAGVTARKAAGTGNGSGTLTIANGAAGNMDAGQHLFAVVGETDTGYLSPPVAMTQFVTTAMTSIDFSNIPLFTGAWWVKRHIVATIRILNYAGDLTGYIYYFIPNATINDNTTTTLSSVGFFDVELIEDASHLFDNFTEIPAGAFLTTYNGRLVIGNGDYGEGVAYLSAPGEPEAIDQVDGALTPPESTVHLTNAQEFRDVLYLFKKDRTFSYIDNGDVPVLWAQPTTIDNGIGCGFHGISKVLDSEGVNIEYIIVAHSSGLYLFTGTYIKPEISWKINTFWRNIDGNDRKTQVMTDSINKRILIVTQTGRMLLADFEEALDPKNIKWTPWSFDAHISTIALFEGPRLFLAASGNL